MGDCHTESFSFVNSKLCLNLPQDVRCFNILREVPSRIFNELEEGKGRELRKIYRLENFTTFFFISSQNRSVLFLTKFHQGIEQTVIIALLPHKLHTVPWILFTTNTSSFTAPPRGFKKLFKWQKHNRCTHKKKTAEK